jgi:hypothetical protein
VGHTSWYRPDVYEYAESRYAARMQSMSRSAFALEMSRARHDAVKKCSSIGDVCGAFDIRVAQRYIAYSNAGAGRRRSVNVMRYRKRGIDIS